MIYLDALHACRSCRVVLPRDSDDWKRRKGKRPGSIYIDCCKECHRESARLRYAARVATPEGREQEREARRRQHAAQLEREPERLHARQRETARRHYKRHRRKLRARARRIYREKASTPEGLAEIAIDYRMRQRGRAQERGEPKRLTRYPGAHEPYSPNLKRDEHFDPRPFLDWVDETFPGVCIAVVAKRLSISERTLRGINDGSMHTASILFVDRAFVTYGRADLLEKIYPLGEKSHV